MERRRWEGEAPGRLDVMGGVADYSGALVLQTPIRATTRVTVSLLEMPGLRIKSDHEGSIILPLPEPRALVAASGDLSILYQWMSEHEVPRWARYPLGCLLLFCDAQGWAPPSGLSLEIRSEIPISMGVSSSAALEVATLRALEACSGRPFTGTALARLAQRAENEVVGAPCGLMDQLASAHGTPGAVLPILCRADILGEPVPLPRDVVIAGWPSGVKHAVADSPYATARAASFMAKRILETALGRSLSYLTELAPSVVHSVSEADLPRFMTGAEFLARHGPLADPLSRIDPDRRYSVRAAAIFPVEENFRSGLAVRLLRGGHGSDPHEALMTVGELMFQGHAGYSSIGLGCEETDAMVGAIRAEGPERGFYGARVSGGGSGGTVVVLLRTDALGELQRMADSLTPSVAGSTRLIV